MTDDERKKLLDELRSASFYRGPEFAICDDAANEIERLAKELEIMRINYKEENLSAQRQWTK
jgi:hypothetical protein